MGFVEVNWKSTTKIKNLHFIRQSHLKGLELAVLHRESFCRNEPFIVLLG